MSKSKSPKGIANSHLSVTDFWAFQRCVETWGVVGSGRSILGALLGYEQSDDLLEVFGENDIHILKLLLSENGYTIYKMLCARREGLSK